ncbi:MAG: hypothetical protein HC825_03350 [Oscillatoriales cyanobacterium RM1_1_9]|nr:hypothetical protein [Oscillatoriales cyanobacterium SM2_3_0]NJO44490.1 hypothetical protein [Oscillatoriales cyanobacterium RM2_1_1]NJO70991.1 hypothetical protein [Oscillatoriales cyanobacterium RM1_1_9]
MDTIFQLVQETLDSGYLSLNVEARLRKLLQTTKYSRIDFDAFIELQNAAIDGKVRQESREQLYVFPEQSFSRAR